MSFLSGLSREIVDTVTTLIENIHSVDGIFKKSDENNLIQIAQENNINNLQYDLTYLYAINALFFVYLKCNGIDAKNHPIKEEMERISSKLKFCKNYTKKDVGKVQIDKGACGRIMRHELWESMQDKKRKTDETVNESTVAIDNINNQIPKKKRKIKKSAKK